MRNKKLLVAAASTALVAVVGIGATLAYFTDSEEASNVVTMGHVDIKLTEQSSSDKADSNEITEEGIAFENVMPGDVINKVATITLENGSRDAWIRMKMDVLPDNEDGKVGIDQTKLNELRDNLLTEITAEGTGWYYNEADGYYYYNQALSGALTSTNFFSEVEIPAGWTNNDAAGKSFKIELTAEAIQRENINPEFDDNNLINQWPVTAEILEYTAE